MCHTFIDRSEHIRLLSTTDMNNVCDRPEHIYFLFSVIISSKAMWFVEIDVPIRTALCFDVMHHTKL